MYTIFIGLSTQIHIHIHVKKNTYMSNIYIKFSYKCCISLLKIKPKFYKEKIAFTKYSEEQTLN